MLLLGVPFHASEIYRISGGYTIDSPDSSFIATLLTAAVHAFRMPAFFLLSGYFAAMLIGRRGAGPWLRGRVIRLGVPLACTTLGLGPLEQALANHFGENLTWGDAFRLAWSAPVMEWVNHRWFLVVLLLFSATLAVFARWLVVVPKADAWLEDQPGRREWAVAIFLLVLLAAPSVAVLSGKLAGEWLTESRFLKQYADEYARYFVFFAAGAVIFAVPGGLKRFLQTSAAARVLLLTTATLYGASYFAFYRPGSLQDHWPASSALWGVRLAVEAIAGLLIARAFFAGMARVFTGPHPLVAYFVDAALCIYLVHEVFLLALGGVLLDDRWPPLVEVLLICSSTLAASVAVYEVARRVPILALALNGVPLNRRQRGSGGPADDRTPLRQ